MWVVTRRHATRTRFIRVRVLRRKAKWKKLVDIEVVVVDGIVRTCEWTEKRFRHSLSPTARWWQSDRCRCFGNGQNTLEIPGARTREICACRMCGLIFRPTMNRGPAHTWPLNFLLHRRHRCPRATDLRLVSNLLLQKLRTAQTS